MVRTGLGILLAVVLSGPLQASEPEAVSLRFRSYRTWKIKLPSEKWFPVKDGIGIGDDLFFVAEMDGNDLRFDTDGDGVVDRTLKPLVDTKTKLSTTRVILKASTAGREFRYAARLRRSASGWEWAPGCAMSGVITTESGPVPIRLIDQDGNGRFGDFGTDALIVGNSDFACLMSETIYVGSELYQIQCTPNEPKLSLSKYAGSTARIDFKSGFESKAVLMSSVIQSVDGKHSFDIGAMAGPVTVPAGRYRVINGTVGLGEHRASILPGRMETIELASDTVESLPWGGPIQSEFQFARVGNQIQFSPEQIWFYGRAGEQYTGWNPIGKSPEFRILNANTGALLDVAILPGSS